MNVRFVISTFFSPLSNKNRFFVPVENAHRETKPKLEVNVVTYWIT